MWNPQCRVLHVCEQCRSRLMFGMPNSLPSPATPANYFSMRSKALATAFQAPNAAFEMRSVEPTGDCFYDCLNLQLPQSGRPLSLVDGGTMRDTVADAIDEDMHQHWRMLAMAGVEGFEWLRHHRAPHDLSEVRAFAKRRGKSAGAGQCLWADEFALETIAGLAGVRLLIFDEQARSSGSRSGRRRDAADNSADSRFLAVGPQSTRVVMLHRSRRQHYSPIFLDGRGVVEVSELPATTRSLWPALITGTIMAASSVGGHASASSRSYAPLAREVGRKKRSRDDDDDDDDDDAALSTASKPCPACTFANSPLLKACEMCSTPL